MLVRTAVRGYEVETQFSFGRKGSVFDNIYLLSVFGCMLARRLSTGGGGKGPQHTGAGEVCVLCRAGADALCSCRFRTLGSLTRVRNNFGARGPVRLLCRNMKDVKI